MNGERWALGVVLLFLFCFCFVVVVVVWGGGPCIPHGKGRPGQKVGPGSKPERQRFAIANVVITGSSGSPVSGLQYAHEALTMTSSVTDLLTVCSRHLVYS